MTQRADLGNADPVVATRAILNRLESLFGGRLSITREFLEVEAERVHAAGLSKRNVATMRALARAFVDGDLDDDALAVTSDSEIEAKLTAIPATACGQAASPRPTLFDSEFGYAELVSSPKGREHRLSRIMTRRGGHLEQPISTDVSGARGLLDREALLETLDRAVTRRITVISAPAGSGKTTLLRAWVLKNRSTLISGRRVALVSVDRDEQDARRFWSAVLDALRTSAASSDSETQLAALAGVDADQLVDMIRSDLDQADPHEPVVLILDDVHELRSAEALAQLERLLVVLPSSAHVVLSSRRDPPIRLHKLRLADEVAEIRGRDLRFTEREARELLALARISLSDGGVAALYERTEGWVAGLRLAVVSMTSHADPERFVADFSGSHRAIGEYLMAEMLERQSSDVQSMLIRTSIVDRLNGELADLLTNRTGSERMLLELEDANAFVVSLDAQRTWFRYHHLLSDFLRLELRRKFADEVPDLHRRAARWFAEHGKAVDAVRHLLAAGDWPDAARLLADRLFQPDARRAGGHDRHAAAILPGGGFARSSRAGVGSRGR